MNEAERFLRTWQAQSHTPKVSPSATVSTPAAPAAPQRRVSAGMAWRLFWTRWTFRGRASRAEYWWAFLFVGLMGVGHLAVTLMLLSLGVPAPLTTLWSALGWLLTVGTFCPSYAVLVRRLHDTGRSGWWYWVFWLVPIAGIFILLCFLLMRGEPHPNRYGPAPTTPS